METQRLSVRDGAAVSAATLGTGLGGTLTVRASELLEVIGTTADGQRPSILTAQTRGIGDAGDLMIETGHLNVRDRAEVSVSSRGSGKAGELKVQANSIQLDKRGTITATSSSGNGGDLTLQAKDLLLLRRNSNISTTAGTEQTGGDGGNIDIDPNFLVAVPTENSDITANAFTGNGGRVDITAQGIFGLQYRDRLTQQSDINASSEFGVDGVVEINTPDVDPSRGLVSLPAVPINTEVAQACTPGGSQQQSEFVVTGRGGLPPSPNEALSSDAIQVDWVTLNPREDDTSPAPTTAPTSPAKEPIVEAQGWIIGDQGEVILTASATPVLPHSNCRTP